MWGKILPPSNYISLLMKGDPESDKFPNKKYLCNLFIFDPWSSMSILHFKLWAKQWRKLNSKLMASQTSCIKLSKGKSFFKHMFASSYKKLPINFPQICTHKRWCLVPLRRATPTSLCGSMWSLSAVRAWSKASCYCSSSGSSFRFSSLKIWKVLKFKLIPVGVGIC